MEQDLAGPLPHRPRAVEPAATPVHRSGLRARCGAGPRAGCPRIFNSSDEEAGGGGEVVQRRRYRMTSIVPARMVLARWMARNGKRCPGHLPSRTVPQWLTNPTTPGRARSPCWMRAPRTRASRPRWARHSELGDRVPIRQPVQLLVPTGGTGLRRSERRAHGERQAEVIGATDLASTADGAKVAVVLDGSSIDVQVDDVSVFLLTNNHCLGATKTGLLGIDDASGVSWKRFASPRTPRTRVRRRSSCPPRSRPRNLRMTPRPPSGLPRGRGPRRPPRRQGADGGGRADVGRASARLPFLDGYRAVAATLVVAYHVGAGAPPGRQARGGSGIDPAAWV